MARDYNIWPYGESKYGCVPVDTTHSDDATLQSEWMDALTFNISVISRVEVPPIWVSSPSDDLYDITLEGQNIQWRVPSNAEVGGGSDAPVLIRDPSLLQEIRLWKGTIDHTNKTLSGPGRDRIDYGTAGDGVPNLGTGGLGNGLSWTGLMQGNQYEPNQPFPEALRFTLQASSFQSGFVAPAVKSDQSASGPFKMGQRFKVDMTEAEIMARTVHGQPTNPTDPDHLKNRDFLRAICRTLSTKGGIISDGTGGGVLLQMESEKTADWPTLVGPDNGSSYGFLVRTNSIYPAARTTDGVPWENSRWLADGGTCEASPPPPPVDHVANFESVGSSTVSVNGTLTPAPLVFGTVIEVLRRGQRVYPYPQPRQ